MKWILVVVFYAYGQTSELRLPGGADKAACERLRVAVLTAPEKPGHDHRALSAECVYARK